MGLGTALSALGGIGASIFGASRAKEKTGQATSEQVSAQREALAYLKEREAIPQALREQALLQLGSVYGLPGLQTIPGGEGQDPSGRTPIGGFMDRVGEGMVRTGQGTRYPQPLSRGEFISGLRDDPFYEQMLEEGEEAVLRGASVTGGLRSGGASRALARSSQDVLRGIYQERMAGLSGLANLPSMAPQIAGSIEDIGRTRAAGTLAKGQIEQDIIGDIAGIGIGAVRSFI